MLKILKKFILEITVLLIIILILLNNYIYLNQATTDFFPLQSSAETPILVEDGFNINIIQPDYLHPFRKLTYEYYDNSKLVAIEQAKSIFSNNMIIVNGDPIALLKPEQKNSFHRNFATNDYANYLFFITEYLLAVGIIALTIIYIKNFFGSSKLSR
ncbi:MAG: hypothetical protein V1898_00145 [Patescibacteria group bacterium]